MTDHSWLGWIVIGLVAGSLAGSVVGMRSMGCVLTTVVGLAGAVIGGAIVERLAPDQRYGYLGSLVVSFIGASLFLGVLRLFGVGPARPRRLRGR